MTLILHLSFFKCFAFSKFTMTTLINILDSDNSNIAYIKTQHFQSMTTIAYIILKFESMIKKPITANHTFFTVVTFSSFTSCFINSLAYISSIVFMALIIFNLEKDFRQDNLPFVCLQFYKHNFLNILAGNICFRIQVKNQ